MTSVTMVMSASVVVVQIKPLFVRRLTNVPRLAILIKIATPHRAAPSAIAHLKHYAAKETHLKL